MTLTSARSAIRPLPPSRGLLAFVRSMLLIFALTLQFGTSALAQVTAPHAVDVLILTGPGGHNLAADNLKKRLGEAGLTWAAFDFSSLSAWTFEQTLELLERDPDSANTFYKNYYEQASKVKSIAELPQGEWHSNENFLSLLNLIRPKVILSTYAISMETISRLKQNKQIANIPIGLIPTDYHPDRYWTYQIPEPADKVFAPTAEWIRTSINYGTSASKLEETGIPGNPKSEDILTSKQVAAQWKELDLNPEITTVFVSGGSGGVGTFSEMLESIRSEFALRPQQKVQIVFATGSNKKSFDAIEKAKSLMPANLEIRALGYTPDLPHYSNYMADIEVTKAGGLTTTQVARAHREKDGKTVSGRPLLLVTPSYGIEGGNSEMAFREKMAQATTSSTLGADLARLIDHPEEQFEMMKNQGQIRSSFHPERIIEWTQRVLNLRTTDHTATIAPSNPRWITEKLNDSLNRKVKPVIIVSDRSTEQLASDGQRLAKNFETTQAAADAVAAKQRLAELKEKYPIRTKTFQAEPFEIAITVDDLPIGAGGFPPGERRRTLQRMIEIFQGHGIKNVYGFVNSTNLEGWTEVGEMLTDWRKAGFKLGNHTDSHPSLTKTSAENYILEIEKADKFLADLGVPKKERRVFRYPFLEEGNTPKKRRAVLKYLSDNGYVVAPVTVDSKDYQFNTNYTKAIETKNEAKRLASVKAGVKSAVTDLDYSRNLSREVFGRDISHILLLHLASINIDSLDQLLGEYEARGAKFVSVERSMKDPAYKVDHGQSADTMMSFIKEMAYSTGQWTKDDDSRHSAFSQSKIRKSIEQSCGEVFSTKVPAQSRRAG